MGLTTKDLEDLDFNEILVYPNNGKIFLRGVPEDGLEILYLGDVKPPINRINITEIYSLFDGVIIRKPKFEGSCPDLDTLKLLLRLI